MITNTGNLGIGDEWAAIQIIAQAQSNRLKAISELIENSIDAKAKNIIIEFVKQNKRLLIKDDGDGFPLKEGKNIPNVEDMPKNICDSIKKRLDERKKKGVHDMLYLLKKY